MIGFRYLRRVAAFLVCLPAAGAGAEEDAGGARVPVSANGRRR